ncbi:hypothetical protein [Gaoshiqia sp. Z1-71]|uniref:hypothetical protein n=1 Tax=Gaoshiqia hydrogeniformans TaxID=3290090 RepID=UPI003BF7C888
MKKYIFSVLFLLAGIGSFAQSNYHYVIIPTGFPGIGSGFNPYGVSSALQQIFNSKSIKSVFETSERPADYCEALTVDLEKVSNMFQNVLKVSLKDCQNRTVWTNEGKGRSKDFQQGYAEALANALSGFDALPRNTTIQSQPFVQVMTGLKQAETISPALSREEIDVHTETGEIGGEVYRPKNLYYNYTYFVDVVDADQGQKRLLIVNGELLGYENLQQLAVLIPSGLSGVYTVQWSRADGSVVTGVANLTSGELKISLPSGSEMQLINLQKY